jgi:gamma-glutamyl-gamma-aminobutyrate hydrolase PuuD
VARASGSWGLAGKGGKRAARRAAHSGADKRRERGILTPAGPGTGEAGLRPARAAPARDARRPIIGITTYLTFARFGAWGEDAALIPAAYVDAVEAAGGRPLLVPPSMDGIEETLQSLDGLLFSGGSDLGPELYGQEPHAETDDVVPKRDHAEIALLQAALERDMPVLAICRGSQVLNVARGGDLVQHLPDVVGDEKHKHTPGVFADHEVELVPETRVQRILGDRAPVKSHHHQGYGRLGQGLREAARADDGTVEALEDSSHRFAVGVLWHPEAGEDLALFEALVEEAARYREERR